MKLKFTLFLMSLLVLFGATANAQGTGKRKVLFIGIDGVRADALQQANTPVIDSLVATGFYTFDSWHTGITVSGPSWSTMLTGVNYPKHGVTNNNYTGSKFNQYPDFSRRVTNIDSTLNGMKIIEWPPLIDNMYNDKWRWKLKTPDGDGDATATVAETQLLNDSIDFAFVYFDQCDLTGHNSGFSPTNPAYMQAIENVDIQVGRVVRTIAQRTNYANENWLILMTTDHGGTGKNHGGYSYVERHIWWLASGKIVVPQQVYGPDPGYINPIITSTGLNQTTVKLSPVQADIAVTAIHHLLYDKGVNPADSTNWRLDGKSWLTEMTTPVTAVDPNMATTRTLKVFPNPTTGQVAIWLDDVRENNLNIRLTDMLGRQHNCTWQIVNNNKVMMNLGENGQGIYMVEVRNGDETYTQRIVVQ
jgi:hypothetical protein